MSDAPVSSETPAASPGASDSPAHDSQAGLRRKLELSRRELLDLTARNRLLHAPRRQSRSSSIEIIDERSEHLHRLLVIDGKSMTFDAAPDSQTTGAANAVTTAPIAPATILRPSEGDVTAFSDVDGSTHPDVESEELPASLEQPADAEDAQAAARRRDDRLQTTLPSNQLQQKLLRTYYAARTYQEEQGVNVLFISLGFLKWYEESKPGTERYAPLLLIPVDLERPSAAARFRVRWSGEDIATNLSLQVKLKAEHRIELPEVEQALDAEEEISPSKYFDAVRSAVSGMKGWEVLDDDAVLGFFSFAKLLMYRDLEPAAWPAKRALDQHPLIRELVGGATAVAAQADAPLCGEDDLIDPLVDPREMMHVVDADSSQALVVEEARRGRNLVIQGPPGTGKSQTIANIIAAAVKGGKRVLFVAEKVAALNVVKDRLSNIGLGDMCLALHSNKARKAAVLEDIGHTLALDRPLVANAEQTADRLREARDRLNAHARAMHQPHQPSGVSAYRCVGELARLRSEGVPTLDFTLDDFGQWTAGQASQRRAGLKELAACARELGLPSQHPWRGVMLESILPMDLDRLIVKFDPTAEAVQAADDEAAALNQLLGLAIGEVAGSPTLATVRQRARAAERIAAAPEMDRLALTDRVWETHRPEIEQVIAAGTQIAATKQRLAGTLAEVAWTTDLAAARRDLAAHGDGLFRFLSSAFRNARAMLSGVLAPGAALPRAHADRLALIDAVLAVQSAQKSIAASSEVARRAFGSMWLGERSNWTALSAIVKWEGECRSDSRMPRDFRQIASRIADAKPLVEAARRTLEAGDRALAAVRDVAGALKLDAAAAFTLAAGPEGLNDPAIERVQLQDLATRLRSWRDRPEELSKWIAYRQRDGLSRAAGLGALCDRLFDGRITPAQAVDRLDAAYHERILRELARDHPSLTAFDGLAHERLQQQFRELDQQRISIARAEVALAHWERIPRGAGAIGEVGVIRRELAKKRRHMPIRQLLRSAGNAVQAIKPVFMMSPLSIAQYIEPGALDFDILLIDEASQVRPVDALGAIARARQIVVVGDDKQLPPTRFFTREFEGEDAADDLLDGEASMTGDLESILGLCSAQNLASRMLRWHYRSRHHSLIAVSNREFYDNRLFVIPSPVGRDSTRGLVLHHVRDGVFDRGGSATNRVEAAAVAQAVMRHARDWPKLSLGVGAFSVQQRDAIIDELERLRRADPSIESFFAADRPEPFFVKNLENIQGDERDVIFISVGYGRDARGGMTMNFGPLSNAGGERRLNVLITRAKARCEVFTSILAGDIDLGRATGKGPAAFKAFLAYAEQGVLEGASSSPANDAMESVLARSLREAGWQVDQHVGVAGFFVDLAVRKAHQPPGEYSMGVECDGPGYAASRSARDRDRTRPFVLSDRGWQLHRVWSLDYFNRPQEQIARMLAALDGSPTAGASAARDAAPDFQREQATSRRGTEPSEQPISVPYKQARVRVPASREIPELPIGKLAEIIGQIIEVEGPIHGDEIAERVRQLWDATRLGPRMVRAIDAALEWAVRTSAAIRTGEFYLRSSASPIIVRDRSEVESASLRDPSNLPPMEIQACLRNIIRANMGASRDEAINAVARTLGFKATTPALREAIDAQVADLLKATVIVEDNGRLRIAS